jgi:hypothetical protein
MKNELNTCFEQNFTTGSYEVGIGHAFEICSSLVHKKKIKIKIIFLHTSYPNCNRLVFGLKEF